MDDNFFIITGIPRSGTTLLCRLLNLVQNVVCMNEIPAFYEVKDLSLNFNRVINRLRAGHLIPMNVNEKDELLTDTQRQKNIIKNIFIETDPEKLILLGSKINIPYLNQLDLIHSQGIKAIAIIRDPIYAIASWNQHQNINEQYVMPEEFMQWPRYSTFPFEEKTLFGRQCEIWEHYINVIQAAQRDGRIGAVLKYEDIIAAPESSIRFVFEYLTSFDASKLVIKYPVPVLENFNIMQRFDQSQIISITRNVMRVCKTRREIWG